MSMHTHQSQSLRLSLFAPCPHNCSLCLCLYSYLEKWVHLYHFSRVHIYALIHNISVSLSTLLHSTWQTLVHPHVYRWPNFYLFWWLSNIPLYICTITMKNSMEALKKLKIELPYDKNPTSGHIPWENHSSKRHMHPSVHCSTMYNSQDMDTT